MEHLSGEELARLIDEAPDAAEQIHLDLCGLCAGELTALVAQRQQLATLCDPPVPEVVRSRVERQLAAEGLLVRPAAAGLRWSRAVAAGFVLFVLGGASGAYIAERLTPASAGSSIASLSDVSDPGSPSRVTEVEAAAAELQRTEAEYLEAVSLYAELSESGEGLDPLNRLAALEGIMLTTEAALREAPADPVINNYHLTALGQRDALMRELQLAEDEQEWF